MTTSFPGSLDAFGNPVASDALNNGVTPHAAQHANANDAIEALEAKVGTGASTPTTGKMLVGGTTAGDSIWDRAVRRNLLANGAMKVSQRRALASGIAAVDWTYQVCDRWKTIQNGAVNPWTISYSSGFAPTTFGFSPASDRILQFTASATTCPKVGAVQLLEAADSISHRLAAVSLQAILIAQASITDIRWAILSWSGTADAPTNPISAWNGAGVNPTLAASWAYVNTPANLGLGGSTFTTKKLENQIVPVNCNNLAVMVWCEDITQTVAEAWGFTDIQLELGVVCTAFEREPYQRQLARCQRYYTKTFEQGVTPAQNVASGNGALTYRATAAGVANYGAPWAFPVTMRAVPTLTFYNPFAAAATWYNGSTSAVSGAASTTALGDRSVFVNNAQAAGDGVSHLVFIHAAADADL